MNTCTSPTAPSPSGHADALLALAMTVKTWARRFDAWLARRAQQARDRETLGRMSERELLDVGLSRGYLDDAANGAFQRDMTH